MKLGASPAQAEARQTKTPVIAFASQRLPNSARFWSRIDISLLAPRELGKERAYNKESRAKPVHGVCNGVLPGDSAKSDPRAPLCFSSDPLNREARSQKTAAKPWLRPGFELIADKPRTVAAR